MPARGWVVGALALILCACGTDGGRDTTLRVHATRSADPPFANFGETRLALSGRCLRLLVATSEAQRVQGLRDAATLAPYDGMLFVYADNTNARFTMANTPLPLDITFFAAGGSPVDHKVMTPCPNGSDATCPIYGSKHAYRFALERAAPASGGGALGACA